MKNNLHLKFKIESVFLRDPQYHPLQILIFNYLKNENGKNTLNTLHDSNKKR
jgi:hypothetical protein